MKVYAVLDEDGASYTIIEMFLDKNKAISFKAALDSNPDRGGYFAFIEEFEVIE